MFGGIAAWFSRGVTILLGLVLMPVLFRHLSKEELGVWLLLGQSWTALALLDFGFGTILTRRIALALGKSSSGLNGDSSQGALGEISDLVATGQRVYRWLALTTLSMSFASGFFYLRGLPLQDVSLPSLWAAWGVLCLSQAVGISAAVWTCLLQGVGYVGWDAILASLVNALTLLIQISLVFLGGGLVSLAGAAAAGAILQRFLIIGFARVRRSELFAQRGCWRADLFRELLAPSFRAWLTSLGYLLVAHTDQFFIAAHKGAAAIPAYRAAFLLVINLHFLAGVFSGASQVFVSHLWQAGDLGQIQLILKRNARIGLLAMGCGAGAILALGPALFELWLGPGNFVGYPVLGIFLATFVLEHHANVFGSCGRATDDEAYALSSVAAGILKLGLAFLLTTRFGLTGLALSTLIAQSLTNDWFMVYRTLNRLRIRFLDHMHEVLLPCSLIFCAALGFGVFLDNLMREQQLPVRVGIVSAAGAALLCGALWRFALNAAQRNRILSRGFF